MVLCRIGSKAFFAFAMVGAGFLLGRGVSDATAWFGLVGVAVLGFALGLPYKPLPTAKTWDRKKHGYPYPTQ